MIADSVPAVVANATQIQVAAGLGTNSCASSCTAHGTCGSNGCRCDATWGGADCSVDLTKLISQNPTTHQYVPNTPAEIYPGFVASSVAPAANAPAVGAAPGSASPVATGAYAAPILSSAFVSSFLGASALFLAMIAL